MICFYLDALWWARSRLVGLQYKALVSGATAVELAKGSQVLHHLVTGVVQQDATEWIRKKLRAVPYWPQGHFLFGLLQLQQGDLEAAYISSQAVRALEGASPRQQLLLAKLHVRRREFAAAIDILVDKQVQQVFAEEAIEELLAAYVGSGASKQASALLETLDEARDTGPIRSIREYLKFLGEHTS
jgi:hypothetical protein